MKELKLISKALQQAKEIKKMSNYEISRRTKISRKSVINVMNGKKSYGIGTLALICDALEVDMFDLFKNIK